MLLRYCAACRLDVLMGFALVTGTEIIQRNNA